MLLMSQNQKTQSLQRKVFTEIGVTDCILFILLNNPLPVVWLISRSCVYDQFYFVLDLDENLGSIRFPLDEFYGMPYQFHQTVVIGKLPLAICDIPGKRSVFLNVPCNINRSLNISVIVVMPDIFFEESLSHCRL